MLNSVLNTVTITVKLELEKGKFQIFFKIDSEFFLSFKYKETFSETKVKTYLYDVLMYR